MKIIITKCLVCPGMEYPQEMYLSVFTPNSQTWSEFIDEAIGFSSPEQSAYIVEHLPNNESMYVQLF